MTSENLEDRYLREIQEEQYPEMFADLAEQISMRLVKRKLIPDDLAAEIGLDTAEWLRTSHYAGTHLYVNKGVSFAHSERDRDIFMRMGKDDVAKIAEDYELTMVRVYQIYGRMRRAMVAKRQGNLFDDTGR